MALLQSGLILDKEELIFNQESKVLSLVNCILQLAQEKYKKLSKKSKRIVKSFRGEDFDKNEIIEVLINDIEDICIEDLAVIINDLPKKDYGYICGFIAALILVNEEFELELSESFEDILNFLRTE